MEMELKIDFYSKEEASVRLEPVSSLANHWGFFALYALRQFYNQGHHPVADALALRLIDLPAEWDFQGRAKLALSGEYNERIILEGWPLLVSYRGKGAKRFECRLQNNRLVLKTSGFGFFGKGIPHYANFSVLVLLRFLLEKNRGDQAFEFGLRAVADACGHFQLLRQITSTNQGDLVLAIIEGLSHAGEAFTSSAP